MSTERYRGQSWEALALCADPQVDANLFLVESDDEKSRSRKQYERALAKQICAACPVKMECLNDAMLAGEHYTIRGGTTPRERTQNRESIIRELYGEDIPLVDLQRNPTQSKKRSQEFLRRPNGIQNAA